jgi:hypothetical protein
MLHNLAHIELNAIDLAWDTVARFSHLQLPAGKCSTGKHPGLSSSWLPYGSLQRTEYTKTVKF